MELNIYIYLAMALFLGLFAGKVTKKIRLPNVTGYIIIGLIVGPHALGLLPLQVVQDFGIISEIALGFIAFSIGSEFKVSYLKKIGKSTFIIAIVAALAAVILVDLALILTGNDLAFSIVLGSIAAATAPAATLMVVKQYKAKGPVTSALLPVVAIDDAAAIMIFGISVAIAKALGSQGDTSLVATLLAPFIEIFGSMIFGGVLGIALTYLTKWFTGRGNRVSSALAMILLCIGASNLLGFSPLLTCMTMSGVYVNLSKVYNVVFELVERVTPPIFILFFFISGANLDLTIIPSVGFVGVLYIVFRVIGKVGGSALGARMAHTEPVVAKYLGYTLIPQAGVAIGLATMAMAVLPEHGPQIQTVILSATVIYELVGPLITKIALIKAGEITL